MPDGPDDILVKPEVMLLEDVLADIAAGRLRVPRFQREFVWRPEQMTDLFDSIERGYPIGSLLVWDTRSSLRSLDKLAEISIPSPPAGGTVSYLLDGHQRLSTLFGALSRRPQGTADDSGWIWRIYRQLGHGEEGASKFRHWKRSGDIPPSYLPMHVVLRTMDFLAYARALGARSREADITNLVEEAEQLAQRIKSYKIAVIRLVGGDLSNAVEVFSRLNSSGQKMTPDQMVSALTYTEATEHTLAERIALLREDLAETGFGNISQVTVFRSILALAGVEDIQVNRWETLAGRVKEDLEEAIGGAERALRLTVRFLRDEVGVPLSRLVPYDAQLILLAAFFGLVNEPTPQQTEILRRWFWSTSWSGFFAGANSTQIKNALKEMQGFANGSGALDLSDHVARPFPDRFDLRSARIRAYIVWDLREFDRRLDANGNKINDLNLIASSEGTAFRHIITRGAGISSPANRIIIPTPPGTSARRALLNLAPPRADEILASHGIPGSAMDRLRAGDEDGFITERATALATWEREFIESMGVRPAQRLQGSAEIDTE